MNYQVTCICGYRFPVTPDKIGKHIACPECHRALIPLGAEADASSPPSATATPASAAAPAIAAGQQTKACPFCGERILAVAKKCRFCNEFIDGSTAAGPTGGKSIPPSTPPIYVLSVSQWDNFFKYMVCLAIVIGTGFLLFKVPFIRDLLGDDPHKLVAGDRSQLIFLGTLILMGMISFVFFVGTRSARCRIWPSRIETQVGFIAKQIDSLEISRITDLELKQGFLSRILGIGTIVIRTTDVSTPMMELYKIPRARTVFRYVQAQMQRTDKGQQAGR